jgi:hypothetical protein|tara:strand:+ start:393 stop:626 length:234 start_codon:yes stop_codon:yes gene_type:complete
MAESNDCFIYKIKYTSHIKGELPHETCEEWLGFSVEHVLECFCDVSDEFVSEGICSHPNRILSIEQIGVAVYKLGEL